MRFNITLLHPRKSALSIYLSTNLYGSLSRDYVSKLLRNEAAQTQNPYVILIPY